MVLRKNAADNLEVQDPTSEGWVPLQSIVPPPNGLPVELKTTQNAVIEQIQTILTTIQETTSALQVLSANISNKSTDSDATLSSIAAQLTTIDTSVQSGVAATERSQLGIVSFTHQVLALTSSAYLVTIPSTAKSFAIACRGFAGDISGDIWIATTATAATTGSDGAISAKKIGDGVEFYQGGLNLSNALELYLRPGVEGITIVIEIWT